MEKEENIEEEEVLSEDKIKNQNKQIKTILVIGAGVILLVLIGFFVISSIKHFKYKGMNFDVEKYEDLIIYRTFFPVDSITGEHIADYNIYLRNDPRELKNIPVTGEINLQYDVVINADEMEEAQCEDNVIAIANMRDVITSPMLKKHFFRNETLKCDVNGLYTYIEIKNSDRNSIVQFGPSCYFINVKDCDVLKTTEKFLIEVLANKS